MKDRGGEVERAFLAVVDLDPSARAARLDELAASDPTLCEEVRSLLAAHERAEGFLDPAELGVGAVLAEFTPQGAPDIPGFTIESLLGAGGMGRVFRALQHRPRRTVALKVIRPDLANEGVLRRFEREAEILAQLEHQGIARVYETGTRHGVGAGPTAYIAMEFIDGVALTEHAAGLGLRARMELMAAVCDAVAYAHRRGVIHRDLKPGNILVGGDGRPRVVDFGVARVVGSDPLATAHTSAGELVGTLQYMSPEQVAGDPSAVDARCDVYALGLLLFEVLAGRAAFDLRGRSVLDALQFLRTAEPPRLADVAPGLRGEPGTIVAKCLEREPGRRYQSVDELADDLRRHLAGLPIRARDDSTLYTLTRQVRRYRRVLLTAGLVSAAFAVVAGVAVSQSARSRVLAAQREAEARRATDAAERAETVGRFVREILTGIDPALVRGRDTTVLREILNRARVDLPAAADNPGAAVLARATVGQALLQVGDYEAAEAMLREAIEIGRASLPDDPETLAAMNDLAILLERLGRADEAESLGRAVFDRRTALLGPHDPLTLQAGSNLAAFLVRLERAGEAIPLLRAAQAAQVRLLGADAPETMQTTGSLGGALLAAGRNEEALGIYTELLDRRRRVLGEDHPDTMTSLSNLAYLHLSESRPAQAAPLLELAAAQRRRILGPAHFETIVSEYNLASARLAAADHAGNEAALPDLVARASAGLGAAHDLVFGCVTILARSLAETGRHGEALALVERHLPDFQAAVEEPDFRVCRLRLARARALWALGREAEALAEADGVRGFLAGRPGMDDDALADAQALQDAWSAGGPKSLPGG